MKTEFPLHSLIFFLFLFVFPTSNLAQELRDADGHILRNEGSYYILPAFRGKGGGGLELAKTEGETCPLTVVQAPSETSRGWPATIWTPPLIAILTPGFYLNVEFQLEDPSACHEESRLEWKVEEGSRVVKIASKEEERLFGPFQIHPYRDNYKLLYCEGVSEGNSDHCKDLGISIDDQNSRRLVVKDGEPLAVQFVKANRRGDEYARMSNV